MRAAPVTEGQALPERRFPVTQRDVDRYAEASGDRNPLHIDPEFARATPFGRTIAHGMMTLALLSQVMTEWGGDAWCAGGAVDVTFLGPVYPGDEVVVSGTVAAVTPEAGGWAVECAVGCRVGERTVLAGAARLTLDRAPLEGGA